MQPQQEVPIAPPNEIAARAPNRAMWAPEPKNPPQMGPRAPKYDPQIGPSAPKYSQRPTQAAPGTGPILHIGWGSTWTLDGAQPGLCMGLKLDQAWGPTWTRDGPSLDQGWGSTWSRHRAQTWTRHGAQPGSGLRLNLDHRITSQNLDSIPTIF